MARRTLRLAVRLWPVLLTLLILGPALGPGFLLTYDMVFVPDLTLRRDFLGLGSGLPRAVPSDAVVAVVDELLPGMLLQKVVLVGALLVAGYGAQRLVPHDSPIARIAATSLYVWNPYVAERLAIGHWPVLLAYAALPWIFDCALRWRRGERALPALVLWLALSALSISGGLMGALVATVAVAVGRRDLRRVGTVVVAALVVNLPWIVAGLLHGRAALTDPTGAVVFAADGEGHLALLPTLLTLGGIWNDEVVPASRLGWAPVVGLVVVLGVCAAGVRPWMRRVEAPERHALVVLAAVGLLVPVTGALMPGFIGDVAAVVPGGGVLRDGARTVGLLAMLEAALFGFGAALLLDRVPQRAAGVSLAVGAALTPLLVLPDLAWGLAGRLDPVHYPRDYAMASDALSSAAEQHSGAAVMLPFAGYRLPVWNDCCRVIDPLGRYLPVNYVSNDDLHVSGKRVAGEDARAARIRALLDQAASGEASDAAVAEQLRGEGVRWLVLDQEAQGALDDELSLPSFSAATVLFDEGNLTILELPGEVTEPERGPAAVTGLTLAWLAATTTVVVAAGAVGGPLVRRLRTSRGSRP